MAKVVGVLAAAVSAVWVFYSGFTILRCGFVHDRTWQEPVIARDGEVAARQDNALDVPYRRYECRQCSAAAAAEAAGLPSDSELPWAVIAGTMKGGTRGLLSDLQQHPSVLKADIDEMHLFDKIVPGSIVNQCALWLGYKKFYKELLAESSGGTAKELRRAGRVWFDKTPSYMALSHVPQLLLCALPEAKVIVQLRDPVERAYSHYKHKNRNGRNYGQSFEQQVSEGIKRVQKTGFLNATTPSEEYEAWLDVSSKSMVGRGLYAVQLRHLVTIFRDHFGEKNLWRHLLILESEWAWEHRQEAYDRVLDFVGLPRHRLVFEPHQRKKSEGIGPMSNESRRMLKDFYRPQNRKLLELLLPFRIEMRWAMGE